MRTGSLVALAALAAIVPAPGVAGADPCPVDPGGSLQPCGIEVAGGDEAWHADNLFSLHWRNPPQHEDPPVVATHYRVRDPAGAVVTERRMGWAAEAIDGLLVPRKPAVYTFELQLENSAGELGPPATVNLRFDDARPGPVEPIQPPGWLGRAAFPYTLKVGEPAEPVPVSGIRGYAISVDRVAESDPCAAADRCTPAELDVVTGMEGYTLPLGALPEGSSYVHAVAVSGSGMKSTSVGHASLRVDTTDPLTALNGVPSGWVNRPVELTATATDAGSGMTPTQGTVEPFTAIRVDGGAPTVATGSAVETMLIAQGVHTAAYYARDAAGNVNDGSGANGHVNPPPATATVRIDTEPPRLAFSNAQDPHDPEAIEAWISDSLSGVDPSRGRIAVRRADSGDRFEALPTQVDGGRLRAHWESDLYPPGHYEFQANGFDLAGNAVATSERANGSPMVLAAPLKTPTKLSIGLAERPAPRVLPLNRPIVLRGRLVGGRRGRLSGVPLRVTERFEAGAAIGERVSTVRTGPDGAFALRLRGGPSRSVVAAFAGTRTLSASRSAPLRLPVRGAVRMRASSAVARIGGRPVVFAGGVRGGEIPPGGAYVQLQFQAPGVPWTEFRTVRTDSRGRFRYAYAFSDDDSRGVRFRFRAYAPAQDDWPYEAAASRPVVVRGS
jgi:hypothetical protein